MNKRTKIIISLVLGVAVIGGIYYLYQKRAKSQPLTLEQKKNRNIVIINTDY